MAHSGVDGRHALHREWTHFQSARFIAVLIATFVLLPSWVGLTTTGTFLLGCRDVCNNRAQLWQDGLVLGLLSWFFFGVLFQPYATAKQIIPNSFDEIQTRLSQLRAQMASLTAYHAVPRSASTEAAAREVQEQLERIEEELEETGLPWVRATGYIRIWERLHRAEEALFEIQPPATVIAEAIYDELRLDGSKIEHCKELLERLKEAAITIDPSARRYLERDAATAVHPLVITSPGAFVDGVVGVDWSATLVAIGGTPPYHWTPDRRSWLTLNAAGELSGTPEVAGRFPFTARVMDSASATATEEFVITVHGAGPATRDDVRILEGQDSLHTNSRTLARATLRTVRRAINEYVDGRYMGFVVTRNHLVETTILIGIAEYVLLAFAIFIGASPQAIAAASAFYLVGAITGLLRRLRGESEEGATGDVLDYGLSTIRLISMPIVSGLAAVLGVVFIDLLSPAWNAVAKTSTDNTVRSLAQIFDLRNGKNVAELFVAAVFGLTPNLLFARLQAQADKYASDVKRSEATQSSPRT